MPAGRAAGTGRAQRTRSRRCTGHRPPRHHPHRREAQSGAVDWGRSQNLTSSSGASRPFSPPHLASHHGYGDGSRRTVQRLRHHYPAGRLERTLGKGPETEADGDGTSRSCPRCRKGRPSSCRAVVQRGQTQPPPRYTEASLLTVMEKHNLGTLPRRRVLKRSTPKLSTGAAMVPAGKAHQLLDLVPAELRSPEMTAKWERGWRTSPGAAATRKNSWRHPPAGRGHGQSSPKPGGVRTTTPSAAVAPSAASFAGKKANRELCDLSGSPVRLQYRTKDCSPTAGAPMPPWSCGKARR